MSLAQTLLADTWGMHNGLGTGWWIVMAVVMVVFMGAMMFGMSRMMGHGSEGSWSPPWDRSTSKETPLEVLERRFAQGEISAEDYRARRDVLTGGAAEPEGTPEDEALTAPRGEGRQ